MRESIDDTQRFITEECNTVKQMLIKKNIEYGNSAVNPMRIFSSCDSIEQLNVRIDDKLSRINNKQDKQIVEDTELDLIGYLILKRVAIRSAFERIKREEA